ncbi:unnamed protein product, partial [Ectocarpus sp. 12 AP-2014]
CSQGVGGRAVAAVRHALRDHHGAGFRVPERERASRGRANVVGRVELFEVPHGGVTSTSSPFSSMCPCFESTCRARGVCNGLDFVGLDALAQASSTA